MENTTDGIADLIRPRAAAPDNQRPTM